MFKIQMKDVELFTNLEVVHYEFNSYLNILHDLKINSGYNEEYWDTWKEYIRILGEYETLKEQLRIDFIIPIVGDDFNGHWEANFDTGEVIIIPNN